MKPISIIILIVIFFSNCTTTTNNSKIIDNKKNNSLPTLVQDTSVIVNRTEGCANFSLIKRLKEPNHNLIIKGKRKLLQKDSLYSLNYKKQLNNEDLLEIFIDKYIGNGIQKSYCSDIFIINSEKPVKLECVSADVTFKISTYGEFEEIISLTIYNGIFYSKNNKIRYKQKEDIVFKNVLISEWGG